MEPRLATSVKWKIRGNAASLTYQPGGRTESGSVRLGRIRSGEACAEVLDQQHVVQRIGRGLDEPKPSEDDRGAPKADALA